MNYFIVSALMIEIAFLIIAVLTISMRHKQEPELFLQFDDEDARAWLDCAMEGREHPAHSVRKAEHAGRDGTTYVRDTVEMTAVLKVRNYY